MVLGIVIWGRFEPRFPTSTVLCISNMMTLVSDHNSKSTPFERPDLQLQTRPLDSVSTSVVPSLSPQLTSNLLCYVFTRVNEESFFTAVHNFKYYPTVT